MTQGEQQARVPLILCAHDETIGGEDTCRVLSIHTSAPSWSAFPPKVRERRAERDHRHVAAAAA